MFILCQIILWVRFISAQASDLIGRVYQHKNKLIPQSFTDKYNLDKLVYYEFLPTINDAILREKQLKKWKRD